jgi:uridine kinase
LTHGIRPALIHLDAWHHPPSIRFGGDDPGEHFYTHAFRFDELFDRLVLPLRRSRSIQLSVELTRMPEDDTFVHTYELADVDVIVLEGIFLLRRDLAPTHDLAFWIECSFETALRRALARNQEGRSRADLRRDYDTIYFAAQRIHLARDEPRAAAQIVIDNDDGFRGNETDGHAALAEERLDEGSAHGHRREHLQDDADRVAPGGGAAR